MEFITRKPPAAIASEDAELYRYLVGLTEEVNRALECASEVSGESNGWSWQRRPDGTAQCLLRVRCTDVCCTRQTGALYLSDGYGGIAYPFEFEKPPVLLISLSETDGGHCFIEQSGKSVGTAKNTPKWHFASPVSFESGACVVSIYARGRVKR